MEGIREWSNEQLLERIPNGFRTEHERRLKLILEQTMDRKRERRWEAMQKPLLEQMLERILKRNMERMLERMLERMRGIRWDLAANGIQNL